MAIPIFKILVFMAVFCFSWSMSSLSDTVIMKDRERVKGVVVEDYSDRVVISTMDGEKELLKNKINKIVYDLEEQNLTSLADFYQDRGMYKTAYYYYEQALKVNPDYKKAREGMNYVGTFVQQTDRMRKLDHIQKMNEEKLWRKGGALSSGISEEERLKKTLGFSLNDIKGSFEISGVEPGSPADAAGLKKGDVILAAWGRTVSYMQPEDVIKKLLSAEAMEVRLSISRSVMLDFKDASGNYSSLLGAQLGYSEMEGLVVEKVSPGGASQAAGVKEGDLLLAIQGESTRYISLKEIESIVRDRKGETLSLDIRRDVVLWKKFENK